MSSTLLNQKTKEVAHAVVLGTEPVQRRASITGRGSSCGAPGYRVRPPTALGAISIRAPTT
ncbi:hypothetical protein [Saccharopolyspora tripterygii]